MAFHRVAHACNERLDHVRAYCMVEHRRRAHLHGAAPEEKVVERVRELRDAANSRKRLVGERLRELHHLCQ